MNERRSNYVPFWGDQVCVFLSIVIAVIAIFAVIMVLAGLNEAARNQGSALNFIAPLACIAPIFLAWGLVLKGIYEGKKWAFILELVFTLISVATPKSGDTSRFTAFAGIGTLFAIARCAYYALRVAGVIGPALR